MHHVNRLRWCWTIVRTHGGSGYVESSEQFLTSRQHTHSRHQTSCVIYPNDGGRCAPLSVLFFQSATRTGVQRGPGSFCCCPAFFPLPPRSLRLGDRYSVSLCGVRRQCRRLRFFVRNNTTSLFDMCMSNTRLAHISKTVTATKYFIPAGSTLYLSNYRWVWQW